MTDIKDKRTGVEHSFRSGRFGLLCGYVLLVVLPIAILAAGWRWEPWVFMWALAIGIFAGCKGLTWIEVREKNVRAPWYLKLGYVVGWPGMDADTFLTGRSPALPSLRSWGAAVAKVILGLGLLLAAVVGLPHLPPLAAGWLGMAGVVFILHFGLFHLAALSWQRVGVDARPVMNFPARSTSVSEFWGVRWNAAFNRLAWRFVFRPLRRRIGPAWAAMAAFAASGLVHDLVISVPARGGWGLPTLYFLLQGAGLLFERSRVGRRLGFGTGWRGWFFTAVVTAGPALILFHPPFVLNVIIPFLEALR